MKKYFLIREQILKKIKNNGGWVNAHCHLDRAFTLTKTNFHLANKSLKEKWFLVDEIKRTSTVSQIYDRMAYATEILANQGVKLIGSFIDIDPIIKDKAMKAAEKLRRTFYPTVKFKFINQVLKGVINKEARRWFDEGVGFVDIIGGLPKKDHPFEEKHLEIILETGKRFKKMVHVHVDQLNDPEEKETELLAKKTIEIGLEGKVVAIHAISLAGQKKTYREKVYQLSQKAKLMFIACPTAWIDHQRSEILMPFHNAITPVDELIRHNLIVALGTDNIADIYKPFSDGDMWLELRLLLEANRFYQIEDLINIAATNGGMVLGYD